MTDRELMQQCLEAMNRSDYLGWQLNIPIIKALRERLAQEDKWQGLTEDEIDDIWNRYCDEMGEASINDAEDIARAVEAKLKEKNT